MRAAPPVSTLPAAGAYDSPAGPLQRLFPAFFPMRMRRRFPSFDPPDRPDQLVDPRPLFAELDG